MDDVHMDEVGGCVEVETKGAGPDTLDANRVMLTDDDVSHPIHSGANLRIYLFSIQNLSP